jgi:meso-butanediol dehydrogenase / (S,S)-butanediol dehydrogenase / diacetyl reductase
LSERVALITGTGRGVGLGVARALAVEGGHLVVSDLDPDTSEASAEQARSLGADAVSIPCDVSEEDQVEALFARAIEAYGRLDVLVSTVAWIDPPGPIAELPTERWHKAIRTNLDSVMYCTRAALQTMIPNRSGVIINVSSVNGTRGFPDRVSYGATKAAIINFTQTTAMENRQYGIRANVLVPGAIAGERNRILREYALERASQTGSQSLPPPEPPIELLDVDWIGRYVAFLVSPEGRFINGQSLQIGESSRHPLQAIFPDR